MTAPDSTPQSCPQGHSVPDELDDCPICGEAVVGTDAHPGRSLWEVMGQTSTPPQPVTVDPDEDDEIRDDTTNEDEADEEVEETPRPKGLWSMMQPDRDARQPEEMEAIEAGPQLPEIEPVELAEAVTDDEAGWEENDGTGWDEDRPEERDGQADSDGAESRPTVSNIPLSRSCRTSLLLGIAALLLAGLGLVPPTFWTSLPALAAGLVAVYTGLVGTGETGTASGSLRGRGEAMVGIGLGTLGMFLPRLLQMLL